MSKITKTALLVKRIQTNSHDFLFRVIPLNRWSNLFLLSWDSEIWSSILDKAKRIVIIIIVIHAINIKNAKIKEIILLAPEKLRW